jgi:hypothetical protein
MGAQEEGASRRQTVQMRRADLGMSREATEPIVLIVDGDEKNVGRRGGGDLAWVEQAEQAAQDQK